MGFPASRQTVTRPPSRRNLRSNSPSTIYSTPTSPSPSMTAGVRKTKSTPNANGKRKRGSRSASWDQTMDLLRTVSPAISSAGLKTVRINAKTTHMGQSGTEETVIGANGLRLRSSVGAGSRPKPKSQLSIRIERGVEVMTDEGMMTVSSGGSGSGSGSEEVWIPPPLICTKGDRLGPGAFVDEAEDLPLCKPIKDFIREAELERERENEAVLKREREEKRLKEEAEVKGREPAKVKKTKSKGHARDESPAASSSSLSHTSTLLKVPKSDPPSYQKPQQQQPKIPFPSLTPLTLAGSRWSHIGRRTSSLQVNHTPVVEKIRISDNSFCYSYRNSYGTANGICGGDTGDDLIRAGDLGVVEIMVAPSKREMGLGMVHAQIGSGYYTGSVEKVDIYANEKEELENPARKNGFLRALRRRLCF